MFPTVTSGSFATISLLTKWCWIKRMIFSVFGVGLFFFLVLALRHFSAAARGKSVVGARMPFTGLVDGAANGFRRRVSQFTFRSGNGRLSKTPVVDNVRR